MPSASCPVCAARRAAETARKKDGAMGAETDADVGRLVAARQFEKARVVIECQWGDKAKGLLNLPLPALTGPTGPRGAHLRPINRTATIRCHPRFALEGQTKRGARRNETDRQVIHARLRSGSAHFSIRPREFWPRGVRCH